MLRILLFRSLSKPASYKPRITAAKLKRASFSSVSGEKPLLRQTNIELSFIKPQRLRKIRSFSEIRGSSLNTELSKDDIFDFKALRKVLASKTPVFRVQPRQSKSLKEKPRRRRVKRKLVTHKLKYTKSSKIKPKTSIKTIRVRQPRLRKNEKFGDKLIRYCVAVYLHQVKNIETASKLSKEAERVIKKIAPNKEYFKKLSNSLWDKHVENGFNVEETTQYLVDNYLEKL